LDACTAFGCFGRKLPKVERVDRVGLNGSFTLATFVSETVGDIDTQQEIETILSVAHHPRWPRQAQW
jgi:hypothetical protein